LKATLREKILKLQILEDEWYSKVNLELENEAIKILKYEGYTLNGDDLLIYCKRIYVPLTYDIQNLILRESHRAVYMAHPGITKVNVDLKPLFFWNEMKIDAVNYVARFL
jgi:hypothetical protein